MIKNCVICNTPFEAKRADAEVCSSACRQKNWRKKAQEQSEPNDLASKMGLAGLNTVGDSLSDPDFKKILDSPYVTIFEPWIQQIRDYCLKTGLTPDQIPEIMEAQRIKIQQLVAKAPPKGKDITHVVNQELSKHRRLPPDGLSRTELLKWYTNPDNK
jgi:hypothetical protein